MDLHDYEIVGVEVNRANRALAITLLSPNSFEKRTLQIDNVHKLFVDGMRMQNVILELEVFTSANSSHRYRRACELLDIASDDSVNFASSQMVMIEASVGAEIALLCERGSLSLGQ